MVYAGKSEETSAIRVNRGVATVHLTVFVNEGLLVKLMFGANTF
jgi:hypothetical protein